MLTLPSGAPCRNACSFSIQPFQYILTGYSVLRTGSQYGALPPQRGMMLISFAHFNQ
jgi:hypothetical protein